MAPTVAGIHITDIEAAINWWCEREPSPDGIEACEPVRALAQVYAQMSYRHEALCDENTLPAAARQAWLAWYATTPDTPCIAICSTSQGDDLCKGCGRTFDEVQRWPEMTPAAKRAVWRRITLEGSAWRFNRYADRVAGGGDKAAGLDIWCFAFDAVSGDVDGASYLDLLSVDERLRLERMASGPARRAFVAARVLLRTALSAAVPGCAPQQWRFEADAHGKPGLAEGAGLPVEAAGLAFNLSHTAGMAVCAVSRHAARVGVDVEPLRVMPRAGALATRYFRADEAQAVQACSDELQASERFLRYWTLKESFAKGVGQGVSLGLSRFAFALQGARAHGAAPRGVPLELDPSLAHEAGRWCCAQWLDPRGFVLAACAEVGAQPLALALRIWHARPLHEARLVFDAPVCVDKIER